MSKITVDEVLVKLLNKFNGFAQQIRHEWRWYVRCYF